MTNKELYELAGTRKEMELEFVDDRYCWKDICRTYKGMDLTYMFTTKINDEIIDVQYTCNSKLMEAVFGHDNQGKKFNVKANIIETWEKLRDECKPLIVINKISIC